MANQKSSKNENRRVGLLYDERMCKHFQSVGIRHRLPLHQPPAFAGWHRPYLVTMNGLCWLIDLARSPNLGFDAYPCPGLSSLSLSLMVKVREIPSSKYVWFKMG
ncbi:hypothetical protein L484_001816 [Morus notabilis]|uniref:Uncharacterized protein n=1 Tax=Morus notabilis TaxID=981085 RepID=W9RD20_9ROSA|nr:uncharacterized protein LOC21385406 [Morus notabilis]EXB68909.1 hypothetical protein L484_001816 [Morus notabilis]